jgi:hypothetical protein
MDLNTIINYINNAVYKRNQARQNKESYVNYASDSDTQAQYHIKQAEDYRSQAKQYEDEELTAQRDVEYYQQQAVQAGYDLSTSY